MVHHGDQYHGHGLHMRSHDFHGVHMVKHSTPWVSLCEQWGTMVSYGDQYHGHGLHMSSHDFHGVHMVKHNTPWVSLCEQWGTMVSYGIPWCPVGTPWDISVRVEQLSFKLLLDAHACMLFSSSAQDPEFAADIMPVYRKFYTS